MSPQTYKAYCVLIVIITTVINMLNLGDDTGSGSASRSWGSGHSSGWSSGGHK